MNYATITRDELPFYKLSEIEMLYINQILATQDFVIVATYERKGIRVTQFLPEMPTWIAN